MGVSKARSSSDGVPMPTKSSFFSTSIRMPRPSSPAGRFLTFRRRLETRAVVMPGGCWNLSPSTSRVSSSRRTATSVTSTGCISDEALDELCKALYAKMYDEEMTAAAEPYALQRWVYGCTEELAATVRHVYDEANEYDVRVFSLKIPGYDRSRGVFTRGRFAPPVRPFLRFVETVQDYSLTKANIDVKGRAFQRVLGPSVCAGMGQYFTPLSDPLHGRGRFSRNCGTRA